MVSHSIILQPDKTLYKYDEVITFACSDGFNLSGQSQRRCQGNGDFLENLPTCKGAFLNIIVWSIKLI